MKKIQSFPQAIDNTVLLWPLNEQENQPNFRKKQQILFLSQTICKPPHHWAWSFKCFSNSQILIFISRALNYSCFQRYTHIGIIKCHGEWMSTICVHHFKWHMICILQQAEARTDRQQSNLFILVQSFAPNATISWNWSVSFLYCRQQKPFW